LSSNTKNERFADIAIARNVDVTEIYEHDLNGSAFKLFQGLTCGKTTISQADIYVGLRSQTNRDLSELERSLPIDAKKRLITVVHEGIKNRQLLEGLFGEPLLNSEAFRGVLIHEIGARGSLVRDGEMLRELINALPEEMNRICDFVRRKLQYSMNNAGK